MTATLTEPGLDFDDVGHEEVPRRVSWSEVRDMERQGWTITPGVELNDGHRVCAVLGDWVRYLNVVEGEA